MQYKKIILSAALSISLLSGCATIDPYTGEQKTSNQTQGALIGAIAAGVVGAAVGDSEGAAIGAIAGAGIGAAIGGQMDKDEAILREKLQNTGVKVSNTDTGLRLTLPSKVTFDTNNASIKESFYGTIDVISEILRQNKEYKISIVGHTDNTGSAQDNQLLSEARSRSVANLLIQNGVSSERIRTSGQGGFKPTASNATATGRAINRRVEMFLFKK